VSALIAAAGIVVSGYLIGVESAERGWPLWRAFAVYLVVSAAFSLLFVGALGK